MTNQITFKVAGNDVLAYFDKVKSEGNQLASSFVDNARKEGDAAKETLSIVEQQLSALERKNKLTLELKKSFGENEFERSITDVFEKRNKAIKEGQDLFAKYSRNEITSDEFKSKKKENSQSISDTYSDEESVRSDYKDYTKKLDEEANEEKIQTRIAKEQLDAVKESSRDYLKALRRGDEDTKSILEKSKNPLDRLAAEIAKERYDKEKGSKGGGESSDGLKKLIGGALSVQAISSIIGTAGTLAGTRSGFDLIGKVEELKGKLLGTTLGTIAGGLIGARIPGVGAFTGAQTGAAGGGAIGATLGATEGEFFQRKTMAMQEYLATRNRYFATTGQNGLATQNMEQYGLSDRDYINSIRQYALSSGRSNGADRNSAQGYFANKGLGVEESTSLSILQLQRSANKDSNKDLANLIGGVLEKGKNSFFKEDSVFLNEFLGKFVSLQKEFLKTQNSVSSGTTFGLLSAFDKVGGQFAARDPRSLGLIEQINNSLINPGSDAAKGLAFLSLRRANPQMDSYELKEEMQKGLSSATYRKAMFGAVDQFGGDETYKKHQFAALMGLSGDYAAARDLYNNRDNPDFFKKYGDIETQSDFGDKALARTTPLEAETAKLSNGLLKTVDDNVSAMKEAFEVAMREVAGKFILVLNNGKYELKEQPIQKNVAKLPSKSQKGNALTADDRPDMRSAMNRQ